MTRLPRPILSSLITLALTPLTAHAAGFGDLVRQSAIGEPFRAEFKLLGTSDADCIRLVPSGIEDGVPDLRGGAVKVTGSGNNTRLVVTRAQPVSDPILRVTLEEVCNARLLRTYTLLLPMTVEANSSPQVQSASTPSYNASSALIRPSDLGQQFTLSSGASLNQLARSLYPSSRSSRRAFIAAVRELNADDRRLRSSRQIIPAGTRLRLPTPDEVASTRDAQRLRAQGNPAAKVAKASQPEAQPVKPTEAPAPLVSEATPPAPAPAIRTDRLMLMGASPEVSGFKLSTRLGDPALVERTTEAERDVLRREQALIMALDSQIIARLELSDRIERLEALQDVLRAEMAPQEGAQHAGNLTSESNAPPPAGTPTVEATPPVVSEAPPPAASPAPAQPPADDLPWWPFGLGLIALLLIYAWRKRSADKETLEFSPAPGIEPRDTPPGASIDSAVAATIAPEQSNGGGGGSFDFSPVKWEAPPPAELDHSISPIVIEEEELVEEHESAVELADIMMSFGRVQGAAETLADFIRGNPKKAVQPWIKLLEVYKTAHMRGEFDALSDKLNKTFNVKAVTWESFDQVKRATESVEQLPHILKAIQNQWMTQDCQIYLQKLLRDNRGGTREGFPLGIVDDLLTLQAILEDQLGAYRISDEEIESMIAASAAAQTAPAPANEAQQNGEHAVGAPDRDSLAPELDFNELPPGSSQDDDFKDIFDSQSSTTLELPDLDFKLDSDDNTDTDNTIDFEHTRIFRRDEKDD